MCCFRRIRRLLKASVNSIPQVFGMNNRKIPFPSFSKPILINPKAFDIIKDIENKDLDDKSVGEIKAYFKKFDSSNKNLNDALLLGLLSKGMSNVAYGTEDLEGSAKLNKVYKKLFGFGAKAAKYPKDNESLYDKHPEMNNKSTRSRGASAKNDSHEKLLHYLKRYG